ncbi:hypothetical protein [Thalassotalea sp. G20_0]|uniref:hypothetical protein n=1 Tax=Thalassotalea sp. G20_0 TaxID=2821093 RepID=UPI001ADC9F93|nr:hypothetical protein [Thalassotalea sp. G20_0]
MQRMREFGNNPGHDNSRRMTTGYRTTGKTAAREITHYHSKLCTCHNSPSNANTYYNNNLPTECMRLNTVAVAVRPGYQKSHGIGKHSAAHGKNAEIQHNAGCQLRTGIILFRNID